jgi:hypothetical protein
MSTQNILTFNVGGIKHQTTKLTINSQSDSVLGRLISEEWNNQNKELFIDRDGTHFRHILNYFRYI